MLFHVSSSFPILHHCVRRFRPRNFNKTLYIRITTENDIAYISTDDSSLNYPVPPPGVYPATKIHLFFSESFFMENRNYFALDRKRITRITRRSDAWIWYAGAVQRRKRFRVVNLRCAFQTRFRSRKNIIKRRKKKIYCNSTAMHLSVRRGEYGDDKNLCRVGAPVCNSATVHAKKRRRTRRGENRTQINQVNY